ncbi:LysR family transcriptional regulator [Pseudobdellovibrio exovorus]|nr:LysR family transcriptional regulator [Pseudobdellovibrio exovorus]
MTFVLKVIENITHCCYIGTINMDYNRVALFISVVEAGSLSEAARRLNVAKSNLSRSLSSLEQELGIQLIYRNTRNFRPTEAGLNFYNQCRGPFFDIKMAAESMKQNDKELKGNFVITAAVDLAHTILPSIVADFSKAYPSLQVEIRAEDRFVNLVKEGVDLALRMGTLSDSDLKATKISDISLILVSTAQYLNSHPRIRTLEQLKEHTYVSFNRRFDKNITLIKRGGSSYRIKMSSQLIANNPIIAKTLTLLGKGIALLPDFICYDELKTGQLVRVLPDFASEASPVHFVWPARGAESPKVRAFVDFSRDTLRKYFITSAID